MPRNGAKMGRCSPGRNVVDQIPALIRHMPHSYKRQGSHSGVVYPPPPRPSTPSEWQHSELMVGDDRMPVTRGYTVAMYPLHSPPASGLLVAAQGAQQRGAGNVPRAPPPPPGPTPSQRGSRSSPMASVLTATQFPVTFAPRSGLTLSLSTSPFFTASSPPLPATP